MKTETAKTAPLSAKCEALFTKLSKASNAFTKANEAFTKVVCEIHASGEYEGNFVKWMLSQCEARGIKCGKSRIYNALKIVDAREGAKNVEGASKLSDTVMQRIAEATGETSGEAFEAFVANVVASGGTEDAVKVCNGSADALKTDPEDRLLANTVKSLMHLHHGDMIGFRNFVTALEKAYQKEASARVKASK